MNRGRTNFSQVMEFLPHKEFSACVTRHGGERYVKFFSCMDQFLVLPESAPNLAHKVEAVLNMGRYDYAMRDTWEESSRLFEEALLAC